MNIFHDIEHAELQRPTVTTLGVFDGLHLGHQAIVRMVVERALLRGVTPTLITFDPHPRQVLRPDTAPPLLQTFNQKMEGLRLLGLQQVVVLNFTPELAALSAEEFVQRFICDALQAREVYLGKGFAFGHQRRGNIELLLQLSQRLGFHAAEVPEVQLRQQRISSTQVRRLLQAGRVNVARRMLGRPYGIEGVVTRGHGIGKQLLYPTANLALENRVLPADGVYVTLTLVDGVWRRSVTNIGKRPTFGGEVASKVETHLIDFDSDLYDQTIRVRMLHRLRGEKKFNGIEELKAQIGRDRDRAVRYFESALVQRNLSFS
ncbi:MAG: bifunctional riboflavin kinase/FAD synthetase [Acidobacteria bacterium]|nr:bifunctional riboflavin kinase/FAD synthetase [Acidobacteriota bacterium]MBI3422457.1 bifunctional riboflavin kinase/FAD synthetase [Acidobacteriota bacterium]